MQMRMYDIKVNDIPKYLTENPADSYAWKFWNTTDTIATTCDHFIFYLQEAMYGGVQ